MATDGVRSCQVVVTRTVSRSVPVTAFRERATRVVRIPPDAVVGVVEAAARGFVAVDPTPVEDGGDVVLVEAVSEDRTTRRRYTIRCGTGAYEMFRRIVAAVDSMPGATTVGFQPDKFLPPAEPPPSRPPLPAPVARNPRPARPPPPPASPAPAVPDPKAVPLPPDDQPPPRPDTYRLTARRTRARDSAEDFDRASADVAELGGNLRALVDWVAAFRTGSHMVPAPDGANTVIVEWRGPENVVHRVATRTPERGAADLYWVLCEVLGRAPPPPEPPETPVTSAETGAPGAAVPPEAAPPARKRPRPSRRARGSPAPR